jgi:hypothetical protein
MSLVRAPVRAAPVARKQSTTEKWRQERSSPRSPTQTLLWFGFTQKNTGSGLFFYDIRRYVSNDKACRKTSSNKDLKKIHSFIKCPHTNAAGTVLAFLHREYSVADSFSVEDFIIHITSSFFHADSTRYCNI